MHLQPVCSSSQMRFSHLATSSRHPDMNTFRSSLPVTAGSRRIAFVVDDDRQVRSYIQAVLEMQHYMVTSFAKPSEALDALMGAEGDISILISDVEMPEMNGIVFTGEALRQFPALPVLMISGCPDMDNRDPPLPLLLKPFLPDELNEAVEQLVRPRGRPDARLPPLTARIPECVRFQPACSSLRSYPKKVSTR